MKFPKLLIPAISLLLVACSGENEKAVADIKEEVSAAPDLSSFNYDTLRGIYTGDFGDSPITIALTFASEGHATGYNVVKGKRRNISGTVKRIENGVLLTLSEPGDDKYDGIFLITMRDDNQAKITGEWESKSGEVKSFDLQRRIYDDAEYDKNSFGKYGETFSDSLGTLYFEGDGTVKYEYYANSGASNEQMKLINGSWKFSTMTVSIFWQPNDIFPQRKSTFLLDPEKETVENDGNDYKERELRGENRILTAFMF